MTTSANVEPMAYCGPGWSCAPEQGQQAGWLFQLWAPQESIEETGQISQSNPLRDHWAASWQDEEGENCPR